MITKNLKYCKFFKELREEICYTLIFKVNDTADATMLHDHYLQIPNFLYQDFSKNFFIFAYMIDGFLSTRKNTEFYNDIVARFFITFKEHKIEKLDTIYIDNKIEKQAKIYAKKIYKMREIARNLDSMSKITTTSRAEKFADFVFWSLKFHAEDLIVRQKIFTFDQLFEFAKRNFIEKENSTLKAKCRSIYNYYEKRDFQISKKRSKTQKTKKEIEMTRRENMQKINAKKVDTNRKKVINLITGLFADQYQKNSGAWYISKIAKELDISRNTVSKYIREFELEKESK